MRGVNRIIWTTHVDQIPTSPQDTHTHTHNIRNEQRVSAGTCICAHCQHQITRTASVRGSQMLSQDALERPQVACLHMTTFHRAITRARAHTHACGGCSCSASRLEVHRFHEVGRLHASHLSGEVDSTGPRSSCGRDTHLSLEEVEVHEVEENGDLAPLRVQLRQE